MNQPTLICFNNNFYLIHTWFYVGGVQSFIMLRILWIYPWGRWDLWLKINDDSKKEKYWERKWKKEIYLYYGVLNNIHGDINYVEDGEGQQQLVEGGDHLRLPVSYSWFPDLLQIVLVLVILNFFSVLPKPCRSQFCRRLYWGLFN